MSAKGINWNVQTTSVKQQSRIQSRNSLAKNSSTHSSASEVLPKCAHCCCPTPFPFIGLLFLPLPHHFTPIPPSLMSFSFSGALPDLQKRISLSSAVENKHSQHPNKTDSGAKWSEGTYYRCGCWKCWLDCFIWKVMWLTHENNSAGKLVLSVITGFMKKASLRGLVTPWKKWRCGNTWHPMIDVCEKFKLSFPLYRQKLLL